MRSISALSHNNDNKFLYCIRIHYFSLRDFAASRTELMLEVSRMTMSMTAAGYRDRRCTFACLARSSFRQAKQRVSVGWIPSSCSHTANPIPLKECFQKNSNMFRSLVSEMLVSVEYMLLYILYLLFSLLHLIKILVNSIIISDFFHCTHLK